MKQLYVRGTATRIRGLLQHVEVISTVYGFEESFDDNNPEPDPEYDDTDVIWETREPVRSIDGQQLYVDDDGKTYTIDQLELRDDD